METTGSEMFRNIVADPYAYLDFWNLEDVEGLTATKICELTDLLCERTEIVRSTTLKNIDRVRRSAYYSTSDRKKARTLWNYRIQGNMLMMDNTPRWLYRFDNFQRAYVLLKEAMQQAAESGLNQLEKEGVIQRFEYGIELAWKTMKDYLEYQNIVLSQVTPRAVIREAFSAKLINDGQTWMDALDARNKMSHTYDMAQFERVIGDIGDQYLPAMEALYLTLLSYRQKNGGHE